MSYALLWIEMLAVCLLWIAMLTALVSRQRALVFATLMIFILLFPLVNLLFFAVASGYLKFVMLFETNWFYYFCTLFIAFLIGMLVILNRAAVRRYDPAAGIAAWSHAATCYWHLRLASRDRWAGGTLGRMQRPRRHARSLKPAAPRRRVHCRWSRRSRQ